MSKNVLFVLTSHDELGNTGRKTGAYAPEFAHPAEVFEKNGYTVSLASIAGGEVPLDGIKDGDDVTADFLSKDEVKSSLANSSKIGDVNIDEVDVIYLAGGHGTMWDFAESTQLADAVASVYDKGGVVAAVCHGPAGLVNVTLSDGKHLVDGKTVSSFTDEEEHAVGLNDVVPFLLESTLTDRGARHEKTEKFAEFAVADSRLVTGQNPASAVKVAELAVGALS